jgi:hypothetical protein
MLILIRAAIAVLFALGLVAAAARARAGDDRATICAGDNPISEQSLADCLPHAIRGASTRQWIKVLRVDCRSGRLPPVRAAVLSNAPSSLRPLANDAGYPDEEE